MTYHVYTDGSCQAKRKKAGSGFLVYTDHHYIGYGIEQYDTSLIVEVECDAIIKAVEFLIDKIDLTEEDTVHIYSDSLKSRDLCLSVLEGIECEDTGMWNYSELEEQLIKLKDLVGTVEVRWVKAHKDEFNSNKFVDRLAKFALMATTI